jgi:hypothetical protein
VADASGRELLNGEWYYYAGDVPPKPPKSRNSTEKKAFDIRMQFAPLSLGVHVWADLLDYPKRKDLATVVFSVQSADDSTVLAKNAVTEFSYDSAESLLWLPKDLPFGNYSTRIEFLDSKGEILDARDERFVHEDLKKKFIWLGNDVGKSIRVNPPFEAVKVEGNRLSVWGRTLTIGPGGFPEMITSQGRELLSRPIALIAEVNGTPGWISN